jgi:hypothetical protein
MSSEYILMSIYNDVSMLMKVTNIKIITYYIGIRNIVVGLLPPY